MNCRFGPSGIKIVCCKLCIWNIDHAFACEYSNFSLVPFLFLALLSFFFNHDSLQHFCTDYIFGVQNFLFYACRVSVYMPVSVSVSMSVYALAKKIHGREGDVCLSLSNFCFVALLLFNTAVCVCVFLMVTVCSTSVKTILGIHNSPCSCSCPCPCQCACLKKKKSIHLLDPYQRKYYCRATVECLGQELLSHFVIKIALFGCTHLDHRVIRGRRLSKLQIYYVSLCVFFVFFLSVYCLFFYLCLCFPFLFVFVLCLYF